MTSIIRKSYVDPETRRNFTRRAWVKIMHPFNPDEFIRSFLSQLHARSSQEQQPILGADVLKKMKTAAVPEHDLADEFMRQVCEHRYLVVLEGLSSMVDWDVARAYLPDTNNGSRIIVSTQQFEIASLCTGHPYQISEIRQFSPDHSVCILFKEVRWYSNYFDQFFTQQWRYCMICSIYIFFSLCVIPTFTKYVGYDLKNPC